MVHSVAPTPLAPTLRKLNLRSGLIAVSLNGHLLVPDCGCPKTPIGGNIMAWNTPKVEELCVGMEINMYFPPEV
ncbi:pyrroloquinoline quinone precursor peptide PqqA [Methylobrevis pamukkalensis]